MKNKMKKIVLTLTLAALTVLACAGFAACGTAAESIEFAETAVTLDSGEVKELTYTVQPENANVKFEISDTTVVNYKDGKLTAITTGTATVKAYSPADQSIYSECKVAVNPPTNYTLYSNDDCKFVYPSSWTRKSVSGTVVAYYATSGANVNLTSEAKTNSYFSANANTFKNAMINAFNQSGITVTFTDCKVEKSNFNGYTRVHVTYDYKANGSTIHQEQMIVNSGSKTYVLTVTNATEKQTATIFSEFVGKK